MRRVLTPALVSLALAGLLAGAFQLSGAFARSRLHLEDRAELTLFPSGAWVRPLTFGRARLAADLAWLEAIQYYGRHRKSDRQYPYARTLFQTLTGLDPEFQTAYIFGALVLSEDAGDKGAARALLNEGMRQNPQSWRLRFEYGFLLFRQRSDMAEAARHLSLASRMPGAPSSVGRLAAFAAGKAGQRELAVELWREVLRNSENGEVRRIARRYLRELKAPEAAAFPREEIE